MKNTVLKNRIKPKLLRDVKTEALLVFIRTTLEQFFEQVEKGTHTILVSDEVQTEEITKVLRVLLFHLQNHVVNSTYLNTITNQINLTRSPALKSLAIKEAPLFIYYDAIVKGIEQKLTSGTKWIPELVIIALLSEWVIEEEKATFLYPFLKDIDYLKVQNLYEDVKIKTNEENKKIIMDMFHMSSFLIAKLKNVKFKSNTKRKSKTRRK